MCNKCSKQYVGETTNSINKRFYQHMYENKHLKDPDNAPLCMSGKTPNLLPNHFAQADHSYLDIKIQILEYITLPPNSQNTTVFRRKWELHSIHQLKTVVPQGINSMDVARCNLLSNISSAIWLLSQTSPMAAHGFIVRLSHKINPLHALCKYISDHSHPMVDRERTTELTTRFGWESMRLIPRDLGHCPRW